MWIQQNLVLLCLQRGLQYLAKVSAEKLMHSPCLASRWERWVDHLLWHVHTAQPQNSPTTISRGRLDLFTVTDSRKNVLEA